MRMSFEKLQKMAAAAILMAGFLCSGVFAQVTPPWDVPGWPGDGTIPLWNGTWSADGSTYNDAIYSTGAHRLHAIGIKGQGVSTAVLDTLYDVEHPAIKDNIVYAAQFTNGPNGTFAPNGGVTGKINVGSEFVDMTTLFDDSSGTQHGTHVAGIVHSMAPNAGLVLLNTTAQNAIGQYYDFTDTAVLIEHAADIASQYNIVSLNGSYRGPSVYGKPGPYDDHDLADLSYPEQKEAVEKLTKSGVLGIFASGNDGWNNYINIPAAYTDSIAIGALHPWGVVAEYSNQSEMIVLMAPGEAINSPIPVWNKDTLAIEHGYSGPSWGGTSMASPHVAGAVALLSSGARMASTEEILQSMIDSADPYIYDGSIVLPSGFVSWSSDPSLIAIFATVGIDITIPHTLDEWREYASMMSAEYLADPLEHVDYRFLRVDKAFMDLTHKRTDLIAGQIDTVDSGLSSIMYAYADELGADINGHAAQVFQRLDALDPASQFIVARQMSPRFAYNVAESAHYGIVGMHRSFGRRTEINRLGQGVSKASSCKPCDEVAACDPCSPCDPCTPCGRGSKVTTTGWLEGFGTGFDRSYTPRSGSYDGHFVGTSFGVERKQGRVTYGIFGNWSDHRVKGEGVADGDWGSFGAYGRIDRRRSFIEGSIAGSFGDYDMKRNILIPGVIFSGNQPGSLVRDWAPDMFEQAKSKYDTQSFSFRLAAGRDVWKRKGWVVGPRAEMSLSYIDMDRYTENGAQSLDLHVNSFKTTYLEGGVGLFAGKFFVVDGQKFVFTGKVMGMAGGTMGGDMHGRFVNNGSAFRVDPRHTTTGWVVPEASLAWNLSDGVVLSGSYSGRFGEKYSENTGSVSLSLYW